MSINAVLFDLDGTLVDTAPDLGAALNLLLARRDFPPLSADLIRPHVSHGARGLVGLGRAHYPLEDDDETLRQEFLDTYAEAPCIDSALFEGMDTVLATLEASARPWGIVTNKPTWLTEPVLDGLALTQRSACVVCGDTTAHAKPHPLPLLHAAAQIKLEPRHCLYVGDDLRDVQAARAAGMPVLAAGYGYLGVASPPDAWGADAVVDNPAAILDWLDGR